MSRTAQAPIVELSSTHDQEEWVESTMCPRERSCAAVGLPHEPRSILQVSQKDLDLT